MALPELPFPAEHEVERVVSDDALVAFESNRYSVAPGYAAQTVTVCGIAEWGQIFEDTTVVVAILDRLLHHATVLQINGDSYRMRGHRARLQQLRDVLGGSNER